jgi:CRP/FNR family cyclic AMP-dependent transcriptional regulator
VRTSRSGEQSDHSINERQLEQPLVALAAKAQLARQTSAKRRSEAHRAHGRSLELRPFAFILEEDPELAEGLQPAAQRAVMQAFRAPVMFVEAPRWNPPQLDPATTYGLLLLDGLLLRRAQVGRAVASELLGSGDVLRPWQEPFTLDSVAPVIEWRVLAPARIAVLDQRVTRLIGQHPELTISFSGRLFRRARYVEFMRAISHLPKVEHRLLAMLWHLASNWGRVTRAGVLVPFRLTHQILGEMVGAQRPTVTTAMHRLHNRGEVVLTDGGYLLPGEPPVLG